jgi:hypothetical protein
LGGVQASVVKLIERISAVDGRVAWCAVRHQETLFNLGLPPNRPQGQARVPR